MKKLFDYTLSIILAIMVSAFLLTWLVMPLKYTAYKRIKIYSYKEVNIAKVNELMSNSPIRGNQSVHLFIVPRWTMFLLNPFIGFGAQGFNYSVINFVYVHQDAAKDTARTLEGIIAHEVTHTDIHDKFGLKMLFAKTWKIEGVCDYISGETSIFNHEFDSVLLKKKNNEPLSSREKYFIYKRNVQTLIDQGQTVETILKE